MVSSEDMVRRQQRECNPSYTSLPIPGTLPRRYNRWHIIKLSFISELMEGNQVYKRRPLKIIVFLCIELLFLYNNKNVILYCSDIILGAIVIIN